MSNFTQNSVNELRAMLVKSGTMTQEQANSIKGKSKLVEAVLSLEELPEPIFEVPVSPINTVESVIDADEKTLTQLDEGWNEHVLSQFNKDELFEGNPKLNGLRRVTEKLIGKIVSSGPVVLNGATDPTNPGRASVIYKIEIVDEFGQSLFFSGVGGAYPGNTNDEYGVYPECIAENRAEARALRRALSLSNVSAEEVTDKDTKEVVRQFLAPKSTDNEWKESENMSEMQSIVITKKVNDLGINLDKFLFKNSHSDIKELTRKNALDLIGLLKGYEDKTIEMPGDIKNG